MTLLPTELYTAAQVREMDRIAIHERSIPGLLLMQRAGGACFTSLRSRWPDVRRVGVVCGTGNNGGDGYVIARLALESGLGVSVIQLGDPTRIKGDASRAREDYLRAGGGVESFGETLGRFDLIVDAVFGTGLERIVEGAWAEALRAINGSGLPVVAVDIPSGLHADTGAVLGVAVEAALTVSFIGLKRGLCTGEAARFVGELQYADLEVPADVIRAQSPPAFRLTPESLVSALPPRRRTDHKGRFGHVLVIGGGRGMAGAVRMAGEAAARSGAGLVSVATRAEHLAAVVAGRPELMCHPVEGPESLRPMFERASVVAVGPGLGQGEWSSALFAAALDAGRPLVVDADALNLLAAEPQRRDDWVLTPHPGEAARLLACTVAEIQANRYAAVEALVERYGGVCVLKGAGSLIASTGLATAVCTAGNPGMASGGMGDVLTGVIAGFLAQGLEPRLATELAVCLHARAADLAAEEGERGLLASDLFEPLHRLVNPGSNP